MLPAKYQANRSSVFGEKSFECFFTIHMHDSHVKFRIMTIIFGTPTIKCKI